MAPTFIKSSGVIPETLRAATLHVRRSWLPLERNHAIDVAVSIQRFSEELVAVVRAEMGVALRICWTSADASVAFDVEPKALERELQDWAWLVKERGTWVCFPE